LSVSCAFFVRRFTLVDRLHETGFGRQTPVNTR
jgi:hypothetical protein